MTIKQVLIWNKGCGKSIRKGKIAAQIAHASNKVILDMLISDIPYVGDVGEPIVLSKRLRYDADSPFDIWLREGWAKVVVGVESEEALLDIYRQAREAKLPSALIQDEGRTEFHGVKTYTAVAIGPAESEKIDPITGDLKLL